MHLYNSLSKAEAILMDAGVCTFKKAFQQLDQGKVFSSLTYREGNGLGLGLAAGEHDSNWQQ